MDFVQKSINRNQPYTKVYHGSGETSPEDRACHFYQNNLYFDASGNLLEEHPYNAEQIAKLVSLGGRPEKVEAPAPESTKNPEVAAQLAQCSNQEVFEAAVNLTHVLAERGEAVTFEPQEDDRDGNIDFILDHV